VPANLDRRLRDWPWCVGFKNFGRTRGLPELKRWFDKSMGERPLW